MATRDRSPAITISNREFVVKPPKYPSDEIKIELGGKWDPGLKGWRLPPTSLNVLTLVDWYGKEILEGAPWEIRNLAQADWGFTGWGSSDLGQRMKKRAHNHPEWEFLYDFQQEAVEYMTCNPHWGSILGLSPGLGKTPTSIVAADILEKKRILILAPLTLARNWIAEFDDWSMMYRSWSQATASHKDPRTECVVTNHETLYEVLFRNEDKELIEIPGGAHKQKLWVEVGTKKNPAPWKLNQKTGKKEPVRKRIVQPRQSYMDVEWDLIIIDESIMLKNNKAVKVRMALELAKYAPTVWLLSGSPTAKYRNDLYPQVKTIMPRGFPSYWRFTEFFCNVDKTNQWGWKIEGDKPNRDPQSYLRDFMFIRNQKDVLEELPDYVYDPIEIDLNPDQRKAFSEMAEDFATTLDSGQQVTASIKIAQMNRMAQITSNMINLPGGKRSSAKEDLLLDLIKNDDIEFPLLVWSWWVPTTHSITDRLLDKTELCVECVTGKMKREDKDDAIRAYKEGELDVLVLQMGVGKFGHTFTDTKSVYYHDRHWDSDAYLQSLRRVKRIGLEHRPRLIVPRSLRSMDPIVELNLSGKLHSVAKVASHDLSELLRSLGSGSIEWEMEYEE